MTTKVFKRSSKKSAGHYIVDARGQKKEVVLPISLYRRMLERLEDIEDLQYIEQAMKNSEFIPWEEAERQQIGSAFGRQSTDWQRISGSADVIN